jgi:oligopeptide transport system substrate-binding protein
MKRIIALCLSALILLAGTAGALAEKNKAAVQEVTNVYSSEYTTFNYMYESTGESMANFIDTLIEYDNYGILQPCLAESWETSEDGLTWTFHLRPGVKWYTADGEEYAGCVAADYVYSAKRVLTAKYASKTADILYVIKNAEKFFNGEITDFGEVGVKALDDYTLQYTLENPVPYFLSMLSYVCFMPANEKFAEEMGDDFGIDNYSILYNGAYILETFEPQSRRIMVRNENYWDKDDIHITKITGIFNKEAGTLAPELFLRGEVTTAVIPATQVESWLKDPQKAAMVRPSRAAFNYSYFYMFNFWPNFPEEYDHDNWLKAANNLNFRKSFFHGLDRIKAMLTESPYSPEDFISNTITPAGFTSAGGVDYTQMGNLAAISNSDSFNPDLALSYKAKAMEELKAAGVTFPVKVYMPYNAGKTANTNRAQVVEQQLEGLLGTDYIDIVIEGYPDTDYLNVTRRAGNYGFMECYWGPDYADPYTFTDPFRIIQKYGYIYMADGMADETTESDAEGAVDRIGRYWKNVKYDTMVGEAYKITTDLAKRFEILANAEAWLIDQAYVIPYCLDGAGYTASYLNPFESQYAPFGVSENRYKYQYVYETPFGAEEYATLLTQWEAERASRLAAAK